MRNLWKCETVLRVNSSGDERRCRRALRARRARHGASISNDEWFSNEVRIRVPVRSRPVRAGRHLCLDSPNPEISTNAFRAGDPGRSAGARTGPVWASSPRRRQDHSITWKMLFTTQTSLNKTKKILCVFCLLMAVPPKLI